MTHLERQKQAYLEDRGELDRAVIARRPRPAAVLECPCPCGQRITVRDGEKTATCPKCGATGAVVWGAGYVSVQA